MVLVILKDQIRKKAILNGLEMQDLKPDLFLLTMIHCKISKSVGAKKTKNLKIKILNTKGLCSQAKDLLEMKTSKKLKILVLLFSSRVIR